MTTITKEISIDMSEAVIPDLTFDGAFTIVSDSEAIARPVDLDVVISAYVSLYITPMLYKKAQEEINRVCADGTVHGWMVDLAEQAEVDEAERRMDEGIDEQHMADMQRVSRTPAKLRVR